MWEGKYAEISSSSGHARSTHAWKFLKALRKNSNYQARTSSISLEDRITLGALFQESWREFSLPNMHDLCDFEPIMEEVIVDVLT